MGTVLSRTPSTSQRIVDDTLNEKEYTFLVLQTEIDDAVSRNSRQDLRRLGKEIAGHIFELKNLIQDPKTRTEIGDRTQRLIHNYELSLAKVRSMFNTIPKSAAVKPNKAPASPGSDQRGLGSPDRSFEDDLNFSNDLIDLSKDLEPGDEPTYANVEFLHQSESQHQVNAEGSGVVKKKPPVPNPRSRQDKLVRDIPGYFARLNEILEKEDIDDRDIKEVLSIRKRTSEVKDIFVDRMDGIFKRYEERTVERAQEADAE